MTHLIQDSPGSGVRNNRFDSVAYLDPYLVVPHGCQQENTVIQPLLADSPPFEKAGSRKSLISPPSSE